MLTKRGTLSVVAAAVLALAACGGKKKAPDNVVGPNGAAGDGLWSMTPASAAAGLVVEDGALQMIYAGAVELMRIADGHPETKKGADEIREELASEKPGNLLDPAFYASAGIDLSKGLAIWVDAQDQVYAVLPITDPTKFVALAGGSTVNEGGVDIDVYDGELSCTTKAGRYVCAPTTAALAEFDAGAPGPLAQLAIDSEVGGQIRVVVDSSRYPIAARLPGLDRYLSDIGALAIGATLERGGVVVRAHLPGKLVAEGQKLAAAPSLLAGKATGERPSGALHARLDPGMFPVGDSAELPNGVKISDLIASLTGEVVGLAHAGTSGSVSFQIGLTKAQPIRNLIEFGCTMAGGLDPNLKLRWENGACRGEILLSGMPPEVRRVSRHDKVAVDISITDNKLDVRLAVGDRGPVTNAPSPSQLGSEMIAGNWNVSMWGEGLSPVYLLDVLKLSAIPPEDRSEAQAVMWMLGHLYEAGAAVGFRDDGIHGLLAIKTFAAAPDEQYAGYQAALKRAVNGDWAGAKADLDALARKAPKGIVARQVGLKSGAWLGVGALGGAVGLAMFTARVGPAAPPPPPVVAPPVAPPN